MPARDPVEWIPRLHDPELQFENVEALLPTAMALPEPLFLGERAVEDLVGPGQHGALDRRVIDLEIGPFGLGDVDAVGSSGHGVPCERRRIKVTPLQANKSEHEQQEDEKHEHPEDANRESRRGRSRPGFVDR